MQGDHWRVAARSHVGLPPLGVDPGHPCGMCGKRWDFGPRGCAHARAAIHPSVCTKGQFKNKRHDAAVEVLCEMYEAIGGKVAADHRRQLNSARTAPLGSVCNLESGNRVDAVFFGAGSGDKDIAIDLSFVCAEAYPDKSFDASIKDREVKKDDTYKKECEKANMEFFPVVLGAHGGFGDLAKKFWDVLVAKAKKVQGRDWRHSWTAMSFSSVWRQKLSIALAKETAYGALQRTPLCSRQRALGVGFGQSGERECVCVIEGRSAAGVERG